MARILFLFFGLAFVAAGSAILYLMTVEPLLTWWSARGWTPTSCVIVSSEVGRHHDSDGDTFSIEISYRYTVAGDEYTCDRYGMMTGSSSGSASKQRVVDQHPPGSEQTCFVSPADPSRAVLNRDFNYATLLGLLGLLFLVPGLFFAYGGLSSEKERRV